MVSALCCAQHEQMEDMIVKFHLEAGSSIKVGVSAFKGGG